MKHTQYFMDKKASAHLEMILSFVLFIGFVFFILIFIRPFGGSTLVGSVQVGLYSAFVDNSSVELTTLFLKMNESAVGCVNLSLPTDLMNYAVSSSAVYDGGVHVVSEIASDGFMVDSTSGDALDVFISPEFDVGNLTGCLDIAEYNWGGIVEEEVISNNSLFLLADRYENDYEGLKGELGVPGVLDFGISSEIVTMERDIPDNSDVVVTEYVEKVVFADGQIKNVRFGFSLW